MTNNPTPPAATGSQQAPALWSEWRNWLLAVVLKVQRLNYEEEAAWLDVYAAQLENWFAAGWAHRPTPDTPAPASAQDWGQLYFDARDALWQFNNLPDPIILRRVADEIDCCPGCDRTSYDFSTGVTECSKADKGECPNDDAEHLRGLAKAIETRALHHPPPRDDAAADDVAAREGGNYYREKCFICDERFREGDTVLDDMSGETGHLNCFGPERDGYIKDLDTGEPLGPDEALPTGYVWTRALATSDYAAAVMVAASERAGRLKAEAGLEEVFNEIGDAIAYQEAEHAGRGLDREAAGLHRALAQVAKIRRASLTTPPAAEQSDPKIKTPA